MGGPLLSLTRRSYSKVNGKEELVDILHVLYHHRLMPVFARQQAQALWREEIFGPVAPIFKFSTEDEAIALAARFAGTEDDIPIDFGGLVTGTDADGDSVTATGSLTVTVDDDTDRRT